MASNAQLKKDITELCVSLELPVNTRGLSNAKLAKLLSDLKAKKKDAENVTQADDTDAPDADGLEGNCHVIAEGKSITSKRGILGPDDKVFESDFVDEKAFESFLKTGHIIAAMR